MWAQQHVTGEANYYRIGVLVAGEIESIKQRALLGIHLREHVGGARLALATHCGARGISQGGFFDFFQTPCQADDTDVDALLGQLTLQETEEEQSQDTEETVDADLLVGPR